MRMKYLLKHQGQFIQSPFIFPNIRFHILVAGYGAGKTSAIKSGIENCLEILQGKKDSEGHSPNILLGGATIAHLEKTTVAMLKEDLDNSKTVYFHDKKNNVITVGNVRIIIVSLSEPSRIVGFNCWAVFLDEVDDLGSISDATDVTFEAIRAANERCRQRIGGVRKPFVCMGSTSQGQKGLYRVYIQFIKSGQAFVLIRGCTRDNPYLDPSYVESLYKTYNEKERRVFLEGYFESIAQGMIIPDFDWQRHWINEDLDRDVGEDETVYWAQDFNTGYNRGCAAIERGGKIYIVKRYEFPDIKDAPQVVRFDFPKNKIIFLPDATSNNQITQFLLELRQHGIYWAMRRKNPAVEDTVFLVNKLLYTDCLYFGKLAKESAEACALGQRDKNGLVPKGIGKLSQIHDIDAIRMVCYFIVSNVETMAMIRRVTIQRRIDKEEEPEKMKNLRNGYTEIAPEVMAEIGTSS